MHRRGWPLLAMVGVLGCQPAGAGDCAADWTTLRGTQEADGGGCGAFIGTSAEVNPSFDWWGASFDRKAHPESTSLEIEAKFSRPLEDGDRPVDLHFRGGYFGVAQNKYYFWDGDAEPFAPAPANPHWTDWQQTKVDVQQETTIAVRQKGVDVEGFINGALVGTFKLNAPPPSGPVGIGFKSAKGKVAKVKFREFTATDL